MIKNTISRLIFVQDDTKLDKISLKTGKISQIVESTILEVYSKNM